MNTRFRLIAAAVFMLAGVGSAADTEVKITKTGYEAGNPAKANPEGTWKKPAGVAWKVIWDYGTKPNGMPFALDLTSGITGGSKNLDTTTLTGTWGPLTAAENLPATIPADYVARVRLLKLVGGEYVEQATDYAPLPPPAVVPGPKKEE